MQAQQLRHSHTRPSSTRPSAATACSRLQHMEWQCGTPTLPQHTRLLPCGGVQVQQLNKVAACRPCLSVQRAAGRARRLHALYRLCRTNNKCKERKDFWSSKGRGCPKGMSLLPPLSVEAARGTIAPTPFQAQAFMLAHNLLCGAT